MANIEVFTTDYCPYCKKAKALLDKKEPNIPKPTSPMMRLAG